MHKQIKYCILCETQDNKDGIKIFTKIDYSLLVIYKPKMNST